MSVNYVAVYSFIVIISIIFILLGLHDMDNGHNLRYLEEKGYNIVETTLDGTVMTGTQAYRQGYMRVLYGVTALIFIPIVSVWRKE